MTHFNHKSASVATGFLSLLLAPLLGLSLSCSHRKPEDTGSVASKKRSSDVDVNTVPEGEVVVPTEVCQKSIPFFKKVFAPYPAKLEIARLAPDSDPDYPDFKGSCEMMVTFNTGNDLLKYISDFNGKKHSAIAWRITYKGTAYRMKVRLFAKDEVPEVCRVNPKRIFGRKAFDEWTAADHSVDTSPVYRDYFKNTLPEPDTMEKVGFSGYYLTQSYTPEETNVESMTGVYAFWFETQESYEAKFLRPYLQDKKFVSGFNSGGYCIDFFPESFTVAHPVGRATVGN
jgi:hypothetical protein